MVCGIVVIDYTIDCVKLMSCISLCCYAIDCVIVVCGVVVIDYAINCVKLVGCISLCCYAIDCVGVGG